MTTLAIITVFLKFGRNLPGWLANLTGHCPFCRAQSLVHESIDPGPAKNPDPNRKISKSLFCGSCRRTLSKTAAKAGNPAP